MGNQHRRRGGRGLSWRSLKDDGTLTERYVLMAMALGFDAETLLEAHRSSADAAALVLPLWLEDQGLRMKIIKSSGDHFRPELRRKRGPLSFALD